MARDEQGPSSMTHSKKMLLGHTTTRQLHDDLIIDAILTRLPPTAVVRCRSVCRAWHTALTSDDFVRAYAAARQPELLFFAPADASTSTGSTTLYTCALRNDDGEAPSTARELLTLGNLSAEHLVVSPRPCHGLTLVSDGRAVEHYVCNLSTGEHVALPPCERAAAVEGPKPMRIGVAGRCLRTPPWIPFEIASTGLGFDPATGEHKVVRLFKRRIGETGCEVCVPGLAGGAWAWAWRRCAGRVPPPSASFVAGLPPVYLRGSLYWLLELNSFTGTDQPVMSFSVGAEQFGWVHMPSFLAQRVGTLTELNGSLCAVVDLRYDHERYSLYTWGGGGDGDTWSKRYSIDLQSLPLAISDEFVEEEDVIPLCSCSNAGGKLLLATGFHKVFAYDPNSVAMERVLWMQEFVDVPGRCQEASFLLHFGLHEDSIASVHRHSGSSKLQVKLGTTTVGKRQVSHVYRQARSRKMRDFLKHFRKEIAGRMNN